jgi:hypothetical protein
MKFASDAARSSAIGTAVSAGMTSYRTDAKTIEVYDGASWNTLGAPDVAGKNKVINGGFDFWQRGTTFTSISANQYTADRWFFYPYGAGQPATITKQTSTPPTGFTGYLRLAQATANSSNFFMVQALETAETVKLAGQVATMSFWYKIPTNFTGAVFASVTYNTSTDSPPTTLAASGTTILSQSLTNTTSWTRVSYSFTVPSTATSMAVFLSTTNSTVNGATLDFTGVQLEAGSVATPFSRAGGTLQGELAACQRYYYRSAPGTTYGVHALGQAWSTTAAGIYLKLPVSMRAVPTSVESSTASGLCLYDGTSRTALNGTPTIDGTFCTPDIAYVNAPVASGLTATRSYAFQNNATAGAYIAFNAEL